MNQQTLALCIPAYNAAAYLPRLLISAQKQHIPFDEILVYDDGSTDNTAAIAAQFGVKVLRDEVNRGCPTGKNRLAEITVCDWIHFHDADDALLPNFTTLAHKWMGLPNPPDIILFDYAWKDHSSGELLSVRRFSKAALKADPILYAIREQINPFCGLYNKRAFLNAGGYDTDPLVLYNEDVAFHCKMAAAGLRFAAENEISIINYRRKNSMSDANKVHCARAHYEVMKKNAAELPAKYHAAIAEKLWLCAGVSASYLDWETADSAAALARKLDKNVRRISSPQFRKISFFSPRLAFRIREYWIRLRKPHLRK